jgi:predicted GH43/DUF377 family glycosyl hydrolase
MAGDNPTPPTGLARRVNLFLRPSTARILLRPFEPDDPQRSGRIISRVMHLTDAEVEALNTEVMRPFSDETDRAEQYFLRRFEAVHVHAPTDLPFTLARQRLIGAYFTQEYAFESSALFNPSLVWHPVQNGVEEGSKRFILSLRATGEGHLSSTVFRTGIIDANLNITIDPPAPYVALPEPNCDAEYHKELFRRKLHELGVTNGVTGEVFGQLDDRFTLDELLGAIRRVTRRDPLARDKSQLTADAMMALAQANYEIQYAADTPLSARIIFPHSTHESNGIEDSRFVQFTESDGSTHYLATYTAFNGRMVFPQLLETGDFLRFRISTLNGSEATGKGMALFPRRIDGQYAMLSRQGGENIYLMFSDSLHFWEEKHLLLKPCWPWEFVQIGNCGSPIETPEGWLVLTHGVGPSRIYSIGAVLLDLENPRRVIGRLRQPLLTPNENERRGYVPNVVYSCGGQVHQNHLILPYAMSDYATSFAIVPLDELLAELRRGGGTTPTLTIQG